MVGSLNQDQYQSKVKMASLYSQGLTNVDALQSQFSKSAQKVQVWSPLTREFEALDKLE